jgi:hypothetical protein
MTAVRPFGEADHVEIGPEHGRPRADSGGGSAQKTVVRPLSDTFSDSGRQTSISHTIRRQWLRMTARRPSGGTRPI